MKTLPEFLLLTPEEQFDQVWNTCTHLASRHEEEITIHLYYGKGLFVEVWMNKYGDLVGIRPFTKYRPGRACLENGLVEKVFWQ